MLPYADLPYFTLLVIVTLPAVLLGLAERSRRPWILAASGLMAVVHFGLSSSSGPGLAVRDLWIAAGFALGQLLLALGFVRLRRRTGSRWIFAAVVALGLAPLLLAKLLPVVQPGSRWGFLGLSFVTFRALDVLVAIQDRLLAGIGPSTYLAYLFFFPTVSSGPIDRYRRFSQELEAAPAPPRAEYLRALDHGVHRIFTGLLYKFLLAALIKKYWLDPVATQYGWKSVASYTYAYSFYLFFDFAGYSAIAVGVSHFFGVRTPENFDRPFLAKNIVEFWNRWHMSLSTWFRDHVYMRFVLAATKGRWFPGRYLASYLGFLLTFLLMGAWHGLQGNYLLYGLYHACLFIGHSVVTRWTRRWPGLQGSRWWRLSGITATFNAVCLGFLIFSGRLG